MAAPNDQFARYYAEKVWEMIPAIFRHEDGVAEKPGVLRAIVELWADQAARVRRSQDRLWEDSFIDLCDDWAVPYLGDLVTTRLVSAHALRARRIDVAKTIYYRRRKGTPRVLEELIVDVTGWEGKVVESFRGMARHRHGLDPTPRPLAGRFSGSPPGGWADLRDVRAAALTDGPWDEYAHVADLRRARGTDGLWNLPKVAFHLFRLSEYKVTGATPFTRAGGATFTFDPSGREVPLFMPRDRPPDWDEWRSALPWELPAPMTCRILGHAEYEIEETLVQALVTAGSISASQGHALRTLVNVHFRAESDLRRQLTDLDPAFVGVAIYDAILLGSIAAECGKQALLPRALVVTPVPGAPIARERTAAGNLVGWTLTVAGKDLIVDPEHGRGKLAAAVPALAAARVDYYYGLSGTIGAGGYPRGGSLVSTPDRFIPASGSGGPISASDLADGVAEIVDSASYGPVAGVTGVRDLTLQARDLARPYVRLAGDWTLQAAAGIEATLVLEGLWIGASAPATIVLQGAWTRVVVRHCTLDPGGTDVNGDPIAPVALRIDGRVDEVVIESSIVSRVAPGATGVIDRITARDSILHAPAPAVPAVELAVGAVTLARVTVFGRVAVERLSASEALITGLVDVTDTQDGCFRFSAAPDGSRLPRPYRAHILTDAAYLFTSRSFGHPGYAQLSAGAPAELQRGAEDGSEIGAWSALASPGKLESLARKVGEYLPFGLIPIFVRQT